MPGIVVGVDGSEHSQKVLEWAMNEAALRQAPLTVLTVHPVARSSWTGSPIIFPEDAPEVEENRKAAEAAVNTAAAKLGVKPPSVTVRSVNGVPAQELISASADADLVVVSSRGGGGFPGLKMGSVSSQVASHAECPVVVIR
jgi:nucleotide-binding universal stress UspA family protein